LKKYSLEHDLRRNEWSLIKILLLILKNNAKNIKNDEQRQINDEQRQINDEQSIENRLKY
jgi:hypothetical protein